MMDDRTPRTEAAKSLGSRMWSWNAKTPYDEISMVVATIWNDLARIEAQARTETLDALVGRVLASYHAGSLDSEAMHDLGMAFDRLHPTYWDDLRAARLSAEDIEAQACTEALDVLRLLHDTTETFLFHGFRRQDERALRTAMNEARAILAGDVDRSGQGTDGD